MIYYAAITTSDGKYEQGLYTPEQFHAATLDPETKIRYMTDFRAKSKDEAREIAIELYSADVETANADGNLLYMSECAEIGDKLERLARRFGLVREFRENCII